MYSIEYASEIACLAVAVIALSCAYGIASKVKDPPDDETTQIRRPNWRK